MAEQELQVARMDEETMEYLNVLFSVCKRFNTDYYHANPKQRAFMDAVATHEYQLKRHMKKACSVRQCLPLWESFEASAATICLHK